NGGQSIAKIGLNNGQTNAVKPEPSLSGSPEERPKHSQESNGSTRKTQRMHKACTTVVQGIDKGPTRSQYRSNAGATRSQRACYALGKPSLMPAGPGRARRRVWHRPDSRASRLT